MNATTKSNLHTNQQGLVSFFVVLIVMILLTLIVLSFATITRREQRQALDRQLNSQAYYAAASGVNDAHRTITAQPELLDKDYTDCDAFLEDYRVNLIPELDGPGGVTSYSCLLVDPTPEQLVHDNVVKGNSVVDRIKAKAGEPAIRSLEITWKNTDDRTPEISGCPEYDQVGTFPSEYDDNCGFGILRFEVVPFGSPKDREALINERAIIFAQPSVFGADVFYSTNVDIRSADFNDQGVVRPVRCFKEPTAYCSLKITNINFNDGYLRITSIYRDADVSSIRALDADDNPIELSEAQVEIDVTGKSNDVLKRIREYRPITTDGMPFPSFALQSLKSQCKRFAVTPNSVSPDSITDSCSPF